MHLEEEKKKKDELEAIKLIFYMYTNPLYTYA